MTTHDLIFSDRFQFRVLRHLLFWMVVLFEKFATGVSYYLQGPDNVPTELFSLPVLLPNLAILATYNYLVVYWAVPKFLMRKKYFQFATLILLLIVINDGIEQYFMVSSDHINSFTFLAWMNAVNTINTGPQVTCIVFVAIKTVKTWYLKEEEKLKLIQENSAAELQLLKAQVHPHFLFNTLNNIYSFTLDNSPKASELVSKLSDVMKYMINDCEASFVSVEKEMKLIKDYVGLEQVRYGSRLSLELNIIGDIQNKFITPLLLIPLIENSFKHGTSRMLKNPWIRLVINISDETLHLTLSNSKPLHSPEKNGKQGIGLANVKKRLQLLYPAQHTLIQESMEESFTIEMKIPLHKNLNSIEQIKKVSTQTPVAA